MMLRPATPLTLLLLAAFILLLLSVISTPVIKAIPLASFNGVDFGVFGYCKADGGCTGIRVGYATDSTTLFGTTDDSDFSLPNGARSSLPSILIVHPVAALLTLICTILAALSHLHSPSHSPRFLLALLILLIPTLLVTLLAFLVDILLFVPHLRWGGWIVLVSTILIVAAGVVTCAMRRTLVGRKARKKRIAENAEMNGENYYARQNTAAVASAGARAETPPPLKSQPPPPMVNGGPGADKLPSFTSYEKNSHDFEDDRVPLNTRTPSNRTLPGNGMQPQSPDEPFDTFAGAGRGFPPRGGPRGMGGGRGGYGGPQQYEEINPIPECGINIPMMVWVVHEVGAEVAFRRVDTVEADHMGQEEVDLISMVEARQRVWLLGLVRRVTVAGQDHLQAMATDIPRWQRKDQVSTTALRQQQATAEAHLLQPTEEDHLDRHQHLVMPGNRHQGRLRTQRAMVDGLRRDHHHILAGTVNNHRREVVQFLLEVMEDNHQVCRRHPAHLPGNGRIRILEAMITPGGSPHPELTKGKPMQLRDSDSDVQGLVGLQRQREHRESPLSITSVYSLEEPYVPPRTAWVDPASRSNTTNPSNPSHNVASPIANLPITELPAHTARGPPIPQLTSTAPNSNTATQIPGHNRYNSADIYVEDVDPRFAEPMELHPPQTQSSAPLPSALTAGLRPQPSQQGIMENASDSHHNNAYLQPSHSYDSFPDNTHDAGTRSPAISDGSNYTSISQRGINPAWQPPANHAMGAGGVPNRKPMGQQRDVLLASNPDFELPIQVPLTPQAAVLPPLIYYFALILLPPFPNQVNSHVISFLRSFLAVIAGILFFRLPLAYHVPFSVGLTYQLALVGIYGGCRCLDAFFISPYLFHHIPRRVKYHHEPRPDETHGRWRSRALSNSYFNLHFLQPREAAITETAITDKGYPESWRDRASWALELELSMRGAGFTWTSADVRHTKKTWTPSVGDRLHSILLHVLPTLGISFAVIRHLYSHHLQQLQQQQQQPSRQLKQEEEKTSSNNNNPFDALPFPLQLLLTAGLGAFLMTAFSLGYSCFAIALAPLKPHPLSYFPPLYTTRVHALTSVRAFWSYGWHRLFSRLFLVYGVWPGEWVERTLTGKRPGEPADVGKVVGGFVCSAVVHSLAAWTVVGGRWEDAGGEARFFLGCGGAVVVEEIVKRIVRMKRKRSRSRSQKEEGQDGDNGDEQGEWYDAWVGRVWWASVLLYNGRHFARGWVQAGLVREMAGL
ncbi:MAG: hypothetical protein Q9197_000831 [Variospora fuerteventurae]